MIELENLGKSYDGRFVFDGMNAVFASGSRTAITGPSGCGKTTLFMILLSLAEPDRGKIIGSADKKFSAVFQDDRLCENLSLYANIKLVCGRKIKKGDVSTAADSLLIGEYMNKPVSVMSGGMKRRAAVLRAVLAEFDILLLDEPFNGLDAEAKRITADFILNRLGKRTLIMITHNQDDAVLMNCDIRKFNEL